MKLKQILLVGTFLFILNKVSACECFSIDTASAQQLLNEVEFVIIGHAIESIDYNPEVREMWNKQKWGYDVLFEIDSVIKGDIGLKHVVLNQLSGGNCSQIFEFEEQYIIVGNQVTKFVNKNPERPKASKGEIPLGLVPPPPPSVYDSIVYCYNNEQEDVDYWNEISTKYTIIYTSQCTSFSMNRQLSNYFLNP